MTHQTLLTPLGPLVLDWRDQAITSARFDDEATPDSELDALRRYFAGELDALDEVAVAPAGTPFQQRVWQRLRAVRPGTTTSYGALADELGSVARAVGGANARNPVALFVPCHRVVGKRGELTGYLYGEERKRWLLEHERPSLIPAPTPRR